MLKIRFINDIYIKAVNCYLRYNYDTGKYSYKMKRYTIDYQILLSK